jgi:hypothetical protein
MIAGHVVEEVRHYLREGSISRREIARRLGISRGTVQSIALGRRRRGPAERRGGNGDCSPPSCATDLAAQPSCATGSANAARCPGCGSMVFMPCLACRVRGIGMRRGGERSS